MAQYLDNLFENVIKKVEKKKKKFVEGSKSDVALTEARMSEIPHEIDDVVHDLAANRKKMEDLRGTWESAGFQDLTPLDDIIKGLVDLTTLVYNKGSLLADQNIGSKTAAIQPQAAPVVAAEADTSLKEDEGNEAGADANAEGDAAADMPAEFGEADADIAQAEEIANSIGDIELPDVDSFDVAAESAKEEGKEISLAECEALCANPANASLRKAFKKCCSDFRHNKPEGSNGEIVKIILTPRNNLRLQFDGCERPAFAYCDGESVI